MNHHDRLLFHNLNLDYPKIIDYTQRIDYEAQTNYTLNRVMNNFISQFINSFENTTFIVNYTDDTFGLITYNILLTIESCYDINFYLYGKNKKTKKYIDNKYVIKKRKLKHLDNIIYIECFNPLYYVEKHKKYFNDLSIVSLIDKFTPEQFIILSHFYSIPSEPIYNINFNILDIFCNRNNLPMFITEYVDLPMKQIKVYNLTGTEEDFKTFDKILEEEDKYMCFYMCPEDKENFIITNLNPFINSRNAAIKGFNLNIPNWLIMEYKKQEDKITCKYSS